MALSLDKIKALIRLANNNPSDNEANLAARKVCKLLAENNFAFFNSRTAADKLNQHASNYGFGSWNPFEDLHEMMRKAKDQAAKEKKEQAKTWNDVKRSEEPQFRSTPPKQETWKGGFRPSKAQEDFFRNAPRVDFTGEGSWVKWDEPNQSRTHQDQYRYDADGKRVKITATRKCTQCGLEVNTYRLREEPFVCNPCHWKEKL